MYIYANLNQVYFSILWCSHALESTFFINQVTVLAYSWLCIVPIYDF